MLDWFVTLKGSVTLEAVAIRLAGWVSVTVLLKKRHLSE